LKAGVETETEVSEAGVEEGVLTAKDIGDGAEVGTDTGAEDDLLVVLGVAEDVDVDTGAETGVETLRAEEVLSTFLIEVEADVTLEEITEAAFVLTASAFVDVVVVDPISICKARVAFMIAFP
jgi:hypothetical protein